MKSKSNKSDIYFEVWRKCGRCGTSLGLFSNLSAAEKHIKMAGGRKLQNGKFVGHTDAFWGPIQRVDYTIKTVTL